VFDNDRQRKAHVLTLLERVDLRPEHFDRYPHEFSGGQRQRIVIARALALQPKFIICDESVSALDVSVQAQVLNLLRQLQQEFGLTYIFISHDLAVVKHISDRMIVMNEGKIEEEGFPEEIYHHPKAEYTRKLIAAIPDLKVFK
jgi:peptide/nickel transport system ATP-binding protein